MTQNLVPNIGVKGIWSAEAPYDQALAASTVYECVGVRKLADVIASGEDGYTKYYQPYNASIADYVTDSQSGACIVSLVAGNGQWCYIPSSRLKAAPSMVGVKYSRVVIGVQLGEIPDELDLSPLTAAIQAATHHYLAITPPVQLTVTSATILKTQESHDSRMSAITAQRSLNKTDYTRCVELTAEVMTLRTKLQIAERYILAHQ